MQAIGDARIAIEETLSGTAIDAEGSVSAGRIPEAKRASFPRLALPWALGAVAIVCAGVAGWLLLKPQPQPNVFRFAVAPPENMVFIAGGEISISPDGRMLVFVAQAEAGTNKPTVLWLRPLDSLTAQPIPGTEGAVGPFWSPDGQQIGFGANGKLEKFPHGRHATDALRRDQLRRCNLEPRWRHSVWERRRLIPCARHGRYANARARPGSIPSLAIWFPQFLPDGRHFIFKRDGTTSEGNFIGAGSLDSKTVERLAHVNSEAVFSPPGYLFYTDRARSWRGPLTPGRCVHRARCSTGTERWQYPVLDLCILLRLPRRRSGLSGQQQATRWDDSVKPDHLVQPSRRETRYHRPALYLHGARALCRRLQARTLSGEFRQARHLGL